MKGANGSDCAATGLEPAEALWHGPAMSTETDPLCSGSTLQARKQAVRKTAARNRNQAFAAEDCAARVRAANAHLHTALRMRFGADLDETVLSGYMPIRSELDPLQCLSAHPGPVCLPVITSAGAPLRFRAWSPGAPMVSGAFGALVPESGPWLIPQALIVPLLAFDDAGYRLGYGGGFYDRTLAGLRADGAVLALGLGFAAQRVAAPLPRESTDERLDGVVTEAGVLWFD